jgi:D-arabinose 1-dehydrogenase-like Zn-dependent alcohol dehydrogenase
VRAHFTQAPLAEINRVLSDLAGGRVDGRIVLTLA